MRDGDSEQEREEAVVSWKRRIERDNKQVNASREPERGCIWLIGFIIGIVGVIAFSLLWWWQGDRQYWQQGASWLYILLPCLFVISSLILTWKRQLYSGILLSIEGASLLVAALVTYNRSMIFGAFYDEAIGFAFWLAIIAGALFLISGITFIISWKGWLP